jgi:hypothetical protein
MGASSAALGLSGFAPNPTSRLAAVAPRRYAHVPTVRRPRAAFDVESPAAAQFCRRLLAQSFRHGLPVSRRFGRLRALAARSRLGESMSVARLPSRAARPDIDEVLEAVGAGWDELGLAELPGALRALALHRRSALTIFIFADGTEPLVVAKVPGDRARLERDAEALHAAEGAEIAPRFLGRLGDAYVQEAVRGAAMPIEPVNSASAGSLDWRPEQEELVAGLVRLAAETASDVRPEQLVDPFDEAPLASGIRPTVLAAVRDLHGLRRAVLTHSDTSPHNCLCADGHFSGLVDWEGARLAGAPGFDVWNHAVSYLEHGLGLVEWSEDVVADAFAAAWPTSPLFGHARTAARECAAAAGVPESLHDQLEIAFFARRLLVRAREPDRFPTKTSSAERMLAVVCGP